MPTHTRATSIFTLHLNTPEAVTALGTYGMVIQDRGDLSISWRAASDEAAILDAKDMLAGLDEPYRITTGLGVHRRTVAEG